MAGLEVLETHIVSADLLGHPPPPETHRGDIESNGEVAGQTPTEVPQRLDGYLVAKNKLDDQLVLLGRNRVELDPVDLLVPGIKRLRPDRMGMREQANAEFPFVFRSGAGRQ